MHCYFLRSCIFIQFSDAAFPQFLLVMSAITPNFNGTFPSYNLGRNKKKNTPHPTPIIDKFALRPKRTFSSIIEMGEGCS